MDRIVVSEAFRIQLDGLSGPVQLVDSAGVPIGQFVPTFVKLDDYDCPYSEAELEKMRSERGGRPLVEIWKSLDAK